MIDVTFKLGGTSYSSKLSTYRVTYETTYGSTLTALDGTEYGRALFRPVITFSLIPMTEEESAALFTLLSNGQSLTVEYTDPNTNEDRTGSFRLASNIDHIFALKSVDGNRRYTGGEIILRQRTVL